MDKIQEVHFKKEIVDSIRSFISDEEGWELLTLLALRVQEELFMLLKETSDYQGSASNLLSLIETNEEMQQVVKAGMAETINKAEIRSALIQTLIRLKDYFQHLKVVIDDETQ